MLALGFGGRGFSDDDDAAAEETRRRVEGKGVDFVVRRTGLPVLGGRGGSCTGGSIGGSTICGIVDVEEEERERERRLERRKANFLLVLLLLLLPSSSSVVGEAVRVEANAALVLSSTSFSSIELTEVYVV